MAKLSLIFVALVLAGVATASLRRVCYYTNWAQYRNGPGKFYPENVDPSLCTHIIYAFAKLIGNHLAAFEWNDESTPWMKGMYERFAAIKQQNPSVKLLLAVGGWNMGSPPFTHMVATDASRREFATTTVDFLRKNNFDGIDMDWEYPANRGSPPEDRHKFTLVLQALHDEFAKENIPAGKERLLISAAVAAGKEKIDTAYEIPEISRLLDFINLMTYDLHGSWEDHTGHNAPLYARSGETGNDTTLNVDWAAQEWLRKGAPRDKLNIGLGLYGRSFKLPWNPSNTNIGCPAQGAGSAGQYTGEGGFLAYYEICEKLNRGATRKYEPEQKVPYMIDNDLWVGYDDPDSLKVKVDYVKAENFGGIMVWALDLDDFSGICGQGKYPLMRSIINELNANSPVQPVTHPVITQAPVTTHAPVITQAPVTTRATVTAQAPMVTTQAPQPTTTTDQTTQQPTTDAPTTKVPSGNHHELVQINNNEFDCTIRPNGYYASPYECTHYYICVAGWGFRTDCHPGLLFNDQTLYCDFPDHVTCSASGGVPAVTQNPTFGHAPDTTTIRATQPTTSYHAPPTHAPIQTTTLGGPVNPANFCKGKLDGFYKDPMDCTHFYQCSFEVSYHEPCPSGTYFSDALQGCDWAANVHNCP